MSRHMETQLGDVAAGAHFKPAAPAFAVKIEAVVGVDEKLTAVGDFFTVTTIRPAGLLIMA